MGEERPQVDTDTMVCNSVEHAKISKSIGVERMFWSKDLLNLAVHLMWSTAERPLQRYATKTPTSKAPRPCSISSLR